MAGYRPGQGQYSQNLQALFRTLMNQRRSPQVQNPQAMMQQIKAQGMLDDSYGLDRSAQRAFSGRDNLKSALLGGGIGFLANRKRKQGEQAMQEALETQMQADQQAALEAEQKAMQKQMEERKQIAEYLKQSMGMDHEKAVQAAAMVQSKQIDLKDLMPKEEKKEKPNYQKIEVTHPDGSTEVMFLTPEEVRNAGRIRTGAPKPEDEDDDTKPVSAMSTEQRTKLGLVTNAKNKLQSALGTLKDGDEVVNIPTGREHRAARRSYREAIDNVLRAESGANITAEERDSAYEKWMPGMTDSDTVANQKISNFMSYLDTQEGMYKMGYDIDTPEPAQGGGFKILSID